MMEIFTGCLSPHVASLRRDHMRLVWNEPSSALERVRVIAWTCDCRATVYELCHGGGVAYVRRTVQLEGAPQVHETYRWSLREVESLWTALLAGEVR
jgi:hypothetical protein